MDKEQRLQNLRRVKKIGELKEAIIEFNNDESLQMKAEGKLLKKPLRIQGETPAQLVTKIIGYNIDKVIKFNIPDKPLRKKKADLTDDEKKEREEKLKEKRTQEKLERKKLKLFSPIRAFISSQFIKYRNVVRTGDYKSDKRALKKQWRKEFSSFVDEWEEEKQEKDEDFEIEEEDMDELDRISDENLDAVIDILERGARGEFTEEFKKKQREEAKKKRDM